MMQTQKFGMTLLVKDLGDKGKSNFSFKPTTMMMKASVDIAHKDMLMNYIHPNDMAMNGKSHEGEVAKKTQDSLLSSSKQQASKEI